ncbi:acyltransferase [Stutzerimonas stutzeri]|uniref:Acyltransferase n=1 Tax=Stutzerimonas stutzeri TaxID=316 RepID=A0A2N8T5E3_STUST|nr:acyltransferase [Stutzerimonas stutzeri]MCQ4325192.1 acyltransferase [Stutzerimonas stutzeri]PNG09970.1 acyltransferase [Stutzerimonas stutzeri]
MQTRSLQHSENNFDFLRFLAASLVVVGHSYWLSGRGMSEPVRLFSGSYDTADIAVHVFFVMSGFLIAGSWHNSRSALEFVVKRALRIFPALIIAVLFAMLVVGPLATQLPLGQYLGSSRTLAYFSNVAMLTQFHLPGVFAANPFPDTVNGSLWTLPYETLMYVTVLLLGLLKVFASMALAVLLLLFVVHFYLLPELGLQGDLLLKITRLGTFFYFGVVFYLYRLRIPWNWRIALALLALTLLSARTELWQPLHALTLPYLTLYVAQLKIPHLSGFGKYGDFSYGIYIFSFPLQQLIMHWAGPDLPLPVFMTLSLLASILLAVFSWHLVEAPALSLKRYLPKRKPRSGAAVISTNR